MALPVILVDSASGSDSLASGAGPGTALTGTNASTNGAGTIVTLDGSPDLSGVATDGSHVIYLADATAGARNFGKITAKDDVAKTVTVANAFGLSLSGKSWAIGGKRASIGGTASIKLWDNNSAAGDAMPGWAVEMQSGHTETLSATGPFGDGRFLMRRAGDTTSGFITLRGAVGAATMPVITSTTNGICFEPFADYLALENFEIRNTNATKTASEAVRLSTLSGATFIKNLHVKHATNKFWRGIYSDANGAISLIMRGCTLANLADKAIYFLGGNICNIFIEDNYIHDTGGEGIRLDCDVVPCIITNNIIYKATTNGIIVSGITGNFLRGLQIRHNTVDSTQGSGNGIEISFANRGIFGAGIVNNILSNNAGYGLKFSHASHTAAYLDGFKVFVDSNDTYNNTSGGYLPASYGSNDPGLDPTFTNAANGDFSIGTNLKAKGYPLGGSQYVGNTSATYSYTDPGVAQRQETSTTTTTSTTNSDWIIGH